MCGIIGIVSRPPTRPTPLAADLIAGLDAALAAVPVAVDVTEACRSVDQALRGLPGVLALVGRIDVVAAIESRLDQLDAFCTSVEIELDANTAGLSAESLEAANAELIDLKDVLWALRHDRLRSIAAVETLAGRDASPGELGGYLAVQQALGGIDRLEVRGRDSAGLHVFVWGHDIETTALATLLAERGTDPLFQSGAVVAANGCLSFVYKAAAEIGELGDNTAALRAALSADTLLRRALKSPDARVAILGHTRWASVGIISEPNTHPLNSYELEESAGARPPYVVAALNGDVDNHADLRVTHGLRIASTITTDAKVIPTLVARHAATAPLAEAFRRTVSEFDGSVAIGVASAEAPSSLFLALRGSGQGLYVGLADDCYVVASEPYGVVEETAQYVRMDGEHGGEIVALDGDRAGELAGIGRLGYDGAAHPVTAADVVTAEVTTRDINRGDAPHFLLKEITEAPLSFAKTLRGKIIEQDGRLRADVGERALPRDVVDRLAAGTITRVRVIGQGTAAVAGQSTAAILDELTDARLDVDAVTATELSGFGMRLDMSDTLAIAVSQSGTTTDTNRTVDLLRARGAAVIGIVNRRGSDLTDKSDGVLYTSDGRDVEMSVASTKAFYAQVAAGALLSCAIAEAAGMGDPRRRHELLSSLAGDARGDAHRVVASRRRGRRRPARALEAVLGRRRQRPEQGGRRGGQDQAQRALLQVDGLRLDGGQEAHRPVVGTAHPRVRCRSRRLDGRRRRQGSGDLHGPQGHPGRRRQRRRDPLSRRGDHRGSLRRSGAGVRAVGDGRAPVRLRGRPRHRCVRATRCAKRANRSNDSSRPISRAIRWSLVSAPNCGRRSSGSTTVCARASTTASSRRRRRPGCTACCRDVLSDRPVEQYQHASGKVGTPAALIDDLVTSLTRAIDELTRPIDTIKHQAKTVTVGISRSDEGVIDRALVQAVLGAGAGRDVLSYRTLKVLADLDPAVAAVVGYTRYRIDGETISIIDRGGISRDLPSRVERNARLVGTKRRVASEREVLLGVGRSDGRTVVFVPEVKSGETTGLTLLHLAFHDRLPVEVDARRAAGLRPPLRPPRRLGHRDRGQLRRLVAGRVACRRAAHRADLRHRRPLAPVTSSVDRP